MTTTSQKAKEALDFLRSHPAVNWDNGDSMFAGMWFHMEECCKRGKSKSCQMHGMTVYGGEPGWEKWKDRFEEKYTDSPDVPLDSRQIYVSYEDYYGEPWKFDHVEYWYEITFFVYLGDPFCENYSECKVENWARYAGPMGGANSFDEMLIDAARAVKEAYGDFNKDDDSMKTPQELAWQKLRYDKNCNFIEDLNNGTFKDNYVSLHDGLMNLRWLKWFMTTDYAMKNWGSYIVEGEEEAPSSYPNEFDRESGDAWNTNWRSIVKKLDIPSFKYSRIILGE